MSPPAAVPDVPAATSARGDSVAVTVRRARPSDVAEILAMVHELADFERAAAAVAASAADLHRALFGPDPLAAAHIAHAGPPAASAGGGPGEAVGMAVGYRTFSTWTGRGGWHVEDLFVRAPWRGHGVGRALLGALAGEGARRGDARLEWAVLDWNTPAIDFYEHLGARRQAQWHSYRLDGAALAELAGSSGRRPAAPPPRVPAAHPAPTPEEDRP